MMERWAIYGRTYNNSGKWSKWGPLFKDRRSFKSRKYANSVMRKHEQGFGPGVELKVKAVIAHSCPTCGAKLID